MAKVLSNSRYEYKHFDLKGTSQAIDTHHIVVRKRGARSFLEHISIFLLLANLFYLLVIKEKSITISLWTILLAAFLVKALHQKPVVKAFGVQLETHYQSGKAVRRFVPIGKILKPVLNESVTPVTCYWSLALIVQGEEELMLVFKEIYPPVKMLVPIWKALCAAIDSTDNLCSCFGSVTFPSRAVI